MPRKPQFNVHCHLLNYDFVPNDVSKLLSKFPEKLQKNKVFKSLVSAMFKLIPGKDKNRVKSVLDTYQLPIEKVSENYAIELTKTGIDIYTPLLMDLEQASKDPLKDQIPYEQQIALIATEAAKFPWRIFPFVMFDPRRANSFEICKKAIETQGYIGVKMYPALGYHPSPDIVEKIGIHGQLSDTPNKQAADQLRNLYAYCAAHHIPITTHVSPGGAYATDMQKNREKYAWPLTEMSNWIDVLDDYEIKINFAHFGGNYLNKEADKRVKAKSWRQQIMNFMLKYNTEDKSRIYTDLSFHDMGLFKSDREEYFMDLHLLLQHAAFKNNILFGTDASMISHTFSEGEYVHGFKTYLVGNEAELIFSDNPT
ncbi:MAG: amidohydrolase family protein, partial [Flavobacteriales bacterium]